jgi:hypothetical protein
MYTITKDRRKITIKQVGPIFVVSGRNVEKRFFGRLDWAFKYAQKNLE